MKLMISWGAGNGEGGGIATDSEGQPLPSLPPNPLNPPCFLLTFSSPQVLPDVHVQRLVHSGGARVWVIPAPRPNIPPMRGLIPRGGGCLAACTARYVDQ